MFVVLVVVVWACVCAWPGGDFLRLLFITATYYCGPMKNCVPTRCSRTLPIAKHIAHVDNDADAKVTLTAPPPDNWKRPPGRPRITWLNTVQRDLRAYSLTLNEAVDLAQNRPLWRLMSTHGATHS